jgi:uncharacterized damage-inducible protein DinB
MFRRVALDGELTDEETLGDFAHWSGPERKPAPAPGHRCRVVAATMFRDNHPMDISDPLRAQLARLLDWEEAHVGFDKAIAGIPADKRGARAPGFEHSVWQLVEHLRLAQKDVLDFCLNPNYVHAMTWPDDYWPAAAPADEKAWDDSVAAFRADCERLKSLARDETVDLHALVPTGQGHQTYLRAILLMADHNAYHVGQIVVVRRALGLWS